MRESILASFRAALKGDYVREIRFSEHLWEPSEHERRRKVGLPVMARRGQSSMEAIRMSPAHSARSFSRTMHVSSTF